MLFENVERQMIRYNGYDPSGIRRVWGQDEYEQTALGFAKEEASDYVRRRPDTAPLDQWTFKRETNDDDWVGQGTTHIVTDAKTGKPVTRAQVEARFK